MACAVCGGNTGSPGAPKSAGAAGRPQKFGKFALRPVSGAAGFSFTDTDPEVIKRVNEQFLKTHQMPPNLQPRSRALQDRTNRNISRGFRKPKDGRQ